MPWRPPPVRPLLSLTCPEYAQRESAHTLFPVPLKGSSIRHLFRPQTLVSSQAPLLSHPTLPSSDSHWPNLQARLKPATVSSITSLVQATILPHWDCHCSLPAVFACPLQPDPSPSAQIPSYGAPRHPNTVPQSRTKLTHPHICHLASCCFPSLSSPAALASRLFPDPPGTCPSSAWHPLSSDTWLTLASFTSVFHTPLC